MMPGFLIKNLFWDYIIACISQVSFLFFFVFKAYSIKQADGLLLDSPCLFYWRVRWSRKV
jgi:hypothetical protein